MTFNLFIGILMCVNSGYIGITLMTGRESRYGQVVKIVGITGMTKSGATLNDARTQTS